MTDTIAYALRAEYDDGSFLGGVLAAGDRDLNTRELLDEHGDGIIVVASTDSAAVLALDEHPALKRVPVPDNRQPPNPYLGWTVASLRAEADTRNLERSGTKDELAARIFENDRGVDTRPPAQPDPAPPPPEVTAGDQNLDTESR